MVAFPSASCACPAAIKALGSVAATAQSQSLLLLSPGQRELQEEYQVSGGSCCSSEAAVFRGQPRPQGPGSVGKAEL